MADPLAFHITWTTYGTWLHGDRRGSVESGTFEIQPGDAERVAKARGQMVDCAVYFSHEQRQLVEQTIRAHCKIRSWTIHALNVRTNHVHLVVTADCRPEEVLSHLKAWTSRKLSDLAGLTEQVARKAGRKKWWTEHGSTKWINDPDYLENAIRYVDEQQ